MVNIVSLSIMIGDIKNGIVVVMFDGTTVGLLRLRIQQVAL